MTEAIDPHKLDENLQEVRGLLDENRDLMDADEYLASLVTLTAVNIAVEKSKVKPLFKKKSRRHA